MRPAGHLAASQTRPPRTPRPQLSLNGHQIRQVAPFRAAAREAAITNANGSRAHPVMISCTACGSAGRAGCAAATSRDDVPL